MLLLPCTSCDWIQKYYQGDALVEVDGQKLYRADVDAITRGATTPQDSARLADAFIQQWTAEVSLYAKA